METIFDDRALVLKTYDSTLLIIADLHLGYEWELSKNKGFSFPPQHQPMLQRILALLTRHSVDALFIIGDVKHTIAADSQFNWQAIPEFVTSLTQEAPTTIIPGNHDGDLEPLLPRNVELSNVHGVVTGREAERVGLLHGHAWPSIQVLETELLVVGHNHPTLRNIRTASAPEIGRSNRIRYAGSIPVFLRSNFNKNCIRNNIGMLENPNDSKGVLVTLPSFNPLFPGIPVNVQGSKLLGPLFENNCADLAGSEVYSIQGTYLGTVKLLRKQRND